jgi:hypothetical protein
LRSSSATFPKGSIGGLPQHTSAHDCKRRSNNPSLKRPGIPVAPE